MSGKTIDGDIRHNLIMSGKSFDELMPSHTFKSSVGYLGLCLILAFLLMSLSFFFIFSQYDSADLLDNLVFALEESMWNILDILLTFLAFVLLIHLTTRVFGAKKSMAQTWQVHAYAYTPSFLLGWIYLFGSQDYIAGIVFQEVFGNGLQGFMLFGGFAFSLLAVINGITGLRRIHGLSLIKATIAELIIPLAAYVALIVAYMVALDAGMISVQIW